MRNAGRRKGANRRGSRWEAAAAKSLARVVAAGVEPYDRQRHLPRLLPLEPSELANESVAARRRILNRLARALRAERNRGRAGHWTYDLNRHIGLSQAYVAERKRLQSQTRTLARRPVEPAAAAGSGDPEPSKRK